jgi:hypothetical protein
MIYIIYHDLEYIRGSLKENVAGCPHQMRPLSRNLLGISTLWPLTRW